MVDKKRHRKKRDTGATGQPAPGKDRSAHEAARGKKMSLDTLSKELPNEHDLTSFADLLAAESDRSAAIMASAFLEQTLYVALNSFLVDEGEGARKQWFEGATAPFATFSAKIMLGYALGIYGPDTKARLDRIRSIRNVFAHRSLPLDFNHPTLRAECAALFEVDFLKGAKNPAKARYCATCLSHGARLIKIAYAHGGREIERELP